MLSRADEQGFQLPPVQKGLACCSLGSVLPDRFDCSGMRQLHAGRGTCMLHSALGERKRKKERDGQMGDVGVEDSLKIYLCI